VTLAERSATDAGWHLVKRGSHFGVRRNGLAAAARVFLILL
jgi:hypothetical protein